MKNRLFTPLSRAVPLFAALLLLTVAGSASFTAAAAQDTAIATRVQFLHAGTDLNQVEVHLNGEGVLDKFAYGDVSDWVTLDPGTVQLTITRDRAGFNYVIFDGVYPVPAGNDYYVVITGDLVMAGAFDTSAAVADASRVQVTHASVDTPAVNIVATGEAVELATDIGFGRTSDSAPLPAGTFDLEVTLADTGEALITVPDVTIESGKSYEFVLVGTPGDDDHPLDVVVLETELTA
ncbi:MAG TPA: DUF4397 domain-containing protein [Thermomicrobiales bacterium]|nr:DUF4397 domain-containing protein [Thermomicrobiales bacterium]